MQEFRSLVSLLQRELEKQERLLETLTRERAAIVKLNCEQLEEVQREKQGLLDEVRSLEERRTTTIESLTKNLPAPLPDKKLASLVQACPTKELKSQLGAVGEQLKRAATAVRDLNTNNGTLLKQSLGLVSSVLSIFNSSAGTDLPTYTPSGQITDASDPLPSRRPAVRREA